MSGEFYSRGSQELVGRLVVGSGEAREGWLAFNRGRNSHRGRGVGTLAGTCGIGRVQTLPVDCFCVGDVGSKAPTERGPWRGCWRPQEGWRKMG